MDYKNSLVSGKITLGCSGDPIRVRVIKNRGRGFKNGSKHRHLLDRRGHKTVKTLIGGVLYYRLGGTSGNCHTYFKVGGFVISLGNSSMDQQLRYPFHIVVYYYYDLIQIRRWSRP